MSLFSRLKKKKKASMDGPAVESPPPDSSPTPPAPERYEPEASPSPPPPPPPVEIQSIFMGLHLSASVASQEGEDSPYLQRANDSGVVALEPPDSPLSSSEQSSFSFLHQSLGAGDTAPSLDGPEPPNDEEGKSPFTFINSEQDSSTTTNVAPPTPPPVVTEPGGDTGKSVFGFITSPAEDETTDATESISSFTFLNKPPEPESHETEGGDGEASTFQASSLEQTTSERNNANKSLDPVGRTLSPGPALSPNRIVKATKPVVGRQQPQTGLRKKKKLKAVRPGQGKAEEGGGLVVQRRGSSSTANRDTDSLSLSSQASSLEGTGSGYSGVRDDSSLADSPKQPVRTSEGTSQPSTSSSLSLGAAVDSPHEDTASTTISLPPQRDDSGSADASKVGSAVDQTQEGCEQPASAMEEDTDGAVKLVELSRDSDTSPTGETKPEKVETDALTLASEDVQLLTEVFTPSPSPQPANYDVELSSADQLAALLESSQSGLDRIRLSLLEDRDAQNAVVEKNLASAQQLRERREHMAELKEQVAKALTDENYELAEELNSELEEGSVEHECVIADHCLTALKQWITRCCAVVQSESDFRSDITAQLAKLKEEQVEAGGVLEREVSSLQAREKMRLKTVEDKIQRERGHIALDREHLERQEQLLEEETSQRAADFISCRGNLQFDLGSMEEEIAVLEIKLAELRREESSVLEAIEVENAKIQGVHDELASEHGQLVAEREQLTTREAELQREVDSLSEAIESSERIVQEQETKRAAIAAVTARVEVASQQFSSLAAVLGEAGSQATATLLPLVDEGRERLQYSLQLTNVQQECVGREEEVRRLTSLVLATQADISSLRKKGQQCEEQLTQLQDSKKTAVAGRQFKEAARIAAEMKVLSEEVSHAQEKLSDCELTLAEKNRELSVVSEQLAAAREEGALLERKEDEVHISVLLKACSLMKAKAPSFSESPLAEVLTQWTTLYESLAENLCQKHGLALADCLPPETPPTLEEDPAPTPLNITDDEKISVPSDELEAPLPATSGEEPGHSGEEEEEEGTGGGVRGEGGEGVEVLKEKAAEIEAAIELACTNEDYVRAADLDEELKKVQSSLEQLQQH